MHVYVQLSVTKVKCLAKRDHQKVPQKNGRPFFGNTPKDEKNSFITFYHYILGRFWLSRLYRWAPQFFETWL